MNQRDDSAISGRGGDCSHIDPLCIGSRGRLLAKAYGRAPSSPMIIVLFNEEKIGIWA